MEITKSSQLADKVYRILLDKCNNEFEDRSWREWHVYLRDLEIESKGFDNNYEAMEELMRIINNKDKSLNEFVVCSDPWVSINQVYEQEGFLIIPLQLAEKIAVLQGIP